MDFGGKQGLCLLSVTVYRYSDSLAGLLRVFDPLITTCACALLLQPIIKKKILAKHLLQGKNKLNITPTQNSLTSYISLSEANRVT